MTAGGASGFVDTGEAADQLEQAGAFLNQDRIIDMRWDQLARQAAQKGKAQLHARRRNEQN